MSDIPGFAYRYLWEERQILSVANLTRDDGITFFNVVNLAGLNTYTQTFPLDQANIALESLRNGKILGAAVLVP
jgi:propanol-preferring alcohol dehydrogenase